LEQSVLDWIYNWPQMAVFLGACMDKTSLFTMADPLARLNVMRYGDGEALNWHFDRSEFTTTLLLQEPSGGGEFLYRTALRSDTDPNYDGVAQALLGKDPEVKSHVLKAGTLNVFKGKNTLHKVNSCKGSQDRFIAVFSYYERPGVRFDLRTRKLRRRDLAIVTRRMAIAGIVAGALASTRAFAQEEMSIRLAL
jgi:hypothetical protein